MSEQQGHQPSASAEIEPRASAAVDLQRPMKEFRGSEALMCSRESGGTGL